MSIPKRPKWVALVAALFAFAAQLQAQSADDLQAYLDQLACQQPARARAATKDYVDIPTDIPAIDLSKFSSYKERTTQLQVRTSVRFTNGTIAAASGFSGGTSLLSISSGATVVIDATAAVSAALASSSQCTATIGVYGASTLIEYGDITAPGQGEGKSIYIDSKDGTYIRHDGEVVGILSNPYGGTVRGYDCVKITAASYTREYGEPNPKLEYTVEGAEMRGKPTIGCKATPTTPVGVYPIVLGQGTVSNLEVHLEDGELTISKAPLTISAGSYSVKWGETTPTFAPSFSGFKNKETKSVLKTQPTISCEATSMSAPGTYDVIIGGAEAGNYDIAYRHGTLTVLSNPVTVTARSYTRQYGENNPTFGYTTKGAALVGKPEIICEATKESPAGTYPIIIKKGSVLNYDDTYVAGTLTITKAPLTISAASYTIRQGDAIPPFELTYTGFKNGDDASILTTPPHATTLATKDSPAGDYAITPWGAESDRYAITYVNGTLTVKQKLVFTINGITYKIVDDDAMTCQVGTGTDVAVSKTTRGTLTIPATADGFRVVGVADGAFASCTGLTQVTLPTGVATIGSKAFYSCTSLSTVRLPEVLVSIGDNAFASCRALTAITLSQDLKSIGQNAFRRCTGLKTVTTYGLEPVAIGTDVFGGVDFATATLYLPRGTRSKYRAIGGWNQFTNIVVMGAEARTLGLTSLPALTYGDSPVALPATTTEGGVLQWTVQDAEVATVSNGSLTIRQAGTTTVTATCGDDDYYLPFARTYPLSIAKAPLTVTALDAEMLQGDELPTLRLAYEGFKYDDDASVLARQPQLTTTATSESPAGEYAITAQGAESPSYDFTYVDGTLTVNKKGNEPVVVTDITTMDNVIYIDEAEGIANGRMTFLVKMKNIFTAKGFNFNLYLPEGVTVPKTLDGKLDVTLYNTADNKRIDTSWANFDEPYFTTDGSLYVNVTMNGSSTISGQDGVVLRVRLMLPKDMPAGSYPLVVKKWSISDDKGSAWPKGEKPELTYELTVANKVRGDANGDAADTTKEAHENEDVNSGDFVTIVNYLFGLPYEHLDKTAADANGDGAISAADLSAITDLKKLGRAQSRKKKKDYVPREAD